jgi:hypothetical protein
MSQETLNAAVLLLRSRALEAYGIIKDMLDRPAAEGDVDKIAAQSLKLAQLEGGMVTLQQYADSLLERPPPTSATDAPPAKSKAPRTVTPEQSPTLRRSLEQEKAKKARSRTKSKKAKNDE